MEKFNNFRYIPYAARESNDTNLKKKKLFETGSALKNKNSSLQLIFLVQKEKNVQDQIHALFSHMWNISSSFQLQILGKRKLTKKATDNYKTENLVIKGFLNHFKRRVTKLF